MLVKITTYNNTVYKFASKTTDTSDGIYLGRLRDDLSLTSMASVSGTVPASQNLTIYNADNYISKSENFWGASLLLTQENGLTWLGKVTFFNFDSDGNLYLTASEKGAPELELQLPDEVRQVYTIDDNFHQSSVTMTIPLVIGGTHSNPITLSTILIDKTRGIYLICVGEIREIVTVYNGTEALPRSAYIPYRGWSTQTEHPGFAYIQLEEPYRYNSDGSYAEINVDVVGLKLGEHTAEECRNGARFLLWFLKTASSGINGWGCGISESEIDVASFNSAISLVDLMGLKLDGIMWLRQSAQNWIDQICQAIHGSYSIGSNGKRKLTIDYAGAASKKTFNASKIILNKYGKDSYVSTVYNKGILSYGYNPITGLFMQSAQFENADSIAQIGEQKFVGESYLIQDASTALAILEYNCKKSLSSAEAIDFTTDDLTTDLFAGDIITLDRSDIGITGEFQITSISTSDTKSEITAVRFDRSVFTVTGSHSNVNWGNEKNITPALTPAQATNLLLSTGFDINQDGTGNPYISGTFTVPEGGWLAAAVQYGIGANPTNFTELALITEGRFKIQPVNVGTVYTVRVRMITATGHSDYITGQITSTGDTVAPDIPTIVLNSTDKTVIVKCAIDNPPSDMGGFQIWRKKHTGEVFTLVGNVAANFGYASFPDHVETFVEYDYKAKSYDRSGNLSDFSQVVSITPTGLEATELAATAIKIPTGSILNINAKGSTTESIKTANGVIDGSGYGHHGKADNTVAISNDVDFGPCFDFAGAGGLIMPNLDISEGMTYIFKVKNLGVNEGTGYSQIFRHYKTSNGIIVRIRPTNSAADIQIYNNSSSALTLNVAIPSDINIFTFAFAVDSSSSAIYINGGKKAESTAVKLLAAITNVPLTINKTTTKPGLFNDFRIYKRRLSDTEIKSINMIPQESMFHAVTADLIGANAVKAIHLDAGSVTANAVGTNQIITDTANIADAIITDAKISGTLGANRIAANSITADKISVSAVPKADTMHLSLAGMSGKTYYNIPDVSGKGHIAKQVGSVPITIASSTTEQNTFGDYTFVIPTATSNYIETDYRPITTKMKNFSIVFTCPTLNAIDNANAYGRLIIGQGSDYNGFGFGINNGNMWGALYRARGGGDPNLYIIPFGTGTIGFFHAAITFMVSGTSVTMKAYKDGVLLGTQVINSIDFSNSLNNFSLHRCQLLGGGGSPYFARERLCNILTYERVLTADEVMALYKAGTDTESGQITADRIATDALKSRNYVPNANTDAGLAFTTNGSFFNLAKGTLATPFFRVGCNANNVYDCQIGKFKVDSGGGLTAAADNSSNAYMTIGAISTTEMTTSTVAANAFYSRWSKLGTISAGTLSEESAKYGFAEINMETTYSGSNPISTIVQAGKLYLRKYSSPIVLLDIETTAAATAYSTAIMKLTGLSSSKYGFYTDGKIRVVSTDYTSDKNLKKDFREISVLNSLKRMTVNSWRFDENAIAEKQNRKADKSIVHNRNIGCMAQEFNEAFKTNKGAEDALNVTDTIGVCMRAIQELAQQVDDLKRQVRSYKRILNISDEQIAEERDKTAIRKLEIAKARQAKRVTLEITAIKEHESPLDMEEIEDVEINTADSDNTNA